MERVADQANLNTAWKRVRENGGAPGIDGITIAAFLEHAKPRSEALRRELLEGSYRPSPLRRVKIPKPAGGERLLGIPTVQDRVVQQAFLQILQPILDPAFSEHSYGFRPNRSAHQAVAAAQTYLQQGYEWVVDFDLEAFFDRVNHDRLMSRLGQRIADRRACWIIRRFLQAGVMENAVLNPTTEGTPQGGPLSPLLANLVLDELDKELERRGLHAQRKAAQALGKGNPPPFGRGLPCRTRPFAQPRVPYISFNRGKEAKRRIAPKALAKAKKRIRELTRKGRANFEAIMAELNRFLTGWLGYFRFCQTPSVLMKLEEWTRRRLRSLIWRQWKRGTTRYRELVKRGADSGVAAKLAGSSDGPWHISRTQLLNQIFPKTVFAAYGLPQFHVSP